jgi:hypothetical protein
VDAAGSLLEQHEDLPPRMVQYLAESAMLGYLMQGKKSEAYQLWTRYKTRMFGDKEPSLLFRLLVAESTAR